jgi:site-specific DNA-cytosine methylase
VALSTQINHISACAGGGGIDLALKLIFGNRLRSICFIEREAYAAATLVARMEDEALDEAPIWDDLTTFDGRPWQGFVDLVSGGIPCQPFSVAGKQLGTNDERWLWEAFFRVVCETRSPLVFVENVRGLLADTGAFGRILTDLANIGYLTEWVCVRAKDTGSSHERARVFILGYSREFARLQKYGSARSRTAKGSSIETHRGSGEPGNELGNAARDHERWDTDRAHGTRQPAGGPVSGLGDTDSSRRQQEPRSSFGYEAKDAGRSAIGRDQSASADVSLDHAASRRCADQPERQRPLHERAEFERADSKLAESASGGQSELWEPPGFGRRQSDGNSNNLADTAAQRTRSVSAGPRGNGSGAVDTGRASHELDHADRPGRGSDSGVTSITGGDRPDHRLPLAPDVAMGDTAGARWEECAGESGDLGEEHPTFERASLPVFPPGPGLGGYGVLDDIRDLFGKDPERAWQQYQAELRNTLHWLRILEEYPEVEPSVQHLVNELPSGMGGRAPSTRVDQLRLMGGAVVPLAAAMAFTILAHRLGVKI